MNDNDLKGVTPESWFCVDCGFNTAPGCLNRAELEAAFATAEEATRALSCTSPTSVKFIQCVSEYGRRREWSQWGGCLCIGCLEKRIGRLLRPRDFQRGHPFSSFPGTARLLKRREAGPKRSGPMSPKKLRNIV